MTDEFHRNVELYKRGLFEHIHFTDRITKQVFSYHPKQLQAIEYLNDGTTSYTGYGGAARGGKSALIGSDALFCAYAYPECANLIGRKNLTMLWETTWKTLLRMMLNFGFEDGKDYTFNGMRHELTFANKSIILAKNLQLKPADKEATDFGSLEILRAYIDQSEHVNIKIIEKVGERVKRRYWTPFKTDTEKNTRKFVRALPSDNPGREAVEWVKQRELEFLDGTMSNVEYQKQVKGNFDFDDDPNVLCHYDKIEALFTNNQILPDLQNKYLTADIARMGSDDAKLYVWHGWVVVERICFDISKTTELQTTIKALRVKHGISKDNSVGDEDGVGGGVIDNTGIRGFINNSRPIQESTGNTSSAPQYQNLKTQCGYRLAKKINQNGIYFDANLSDADKQCIMEEVDQLRSWKTEDDGKLRLKPKKEIKPDLGRSPDDLDNLTMRMIFELEIKTPVYYYETVPSIPTEAKRIPSGLGMIQKPGYYCLLDAYVHESAIYIEEVLFTNELYAAKTAEKKAIVDALNEIEFKKDHRIMANLGAQVENRDLRLSGYNITPVKELIDSGIKKVQSYDIKVTENSLNVIKALDNWYWKTDDNGKPSPDPDGKEPEALTAIRNIVASKAFGEW